MSTDKNEHKLEPLRPTGVDFGVAESKFNTFSVCVPEGTRREDLTESAFWTHLARRIPSGSEIRVVTADQKFRALLYVLLQQGNDLFLKEVQFTELMTQDEQKAWSDSLFPGYQMKNGGAAGYYVVNVTTGERVPLPKGGYKNPDDLVRAMTDYLKAIAA